MKKQIKINGTPVGEIQIGSPAVIMEGELTRRTSTVLAIYAESKNKLDCVIMAPEMVRVILPDPQPLTQMIYSVQEEWADRGECGNSVSQAYTSEESALQFMMKQLREEMEDGLVSGMRSDKKFVEESYDDSYECFIDGDYYENHYRIFITSQQIIVTPEFVREMAGIYHLSMFMEDFESMLEQEDDITPEEREWLLAQPDIIDRISTSFDNYDAFWDCYWEAFRDIADDKLEEYRKNTMEDQNGTDNIQ